MYVTFLGSIYVLKTSVVECRLILLIDPRSMLHRLLGLHLMDIPLTSKLTVVQEWTNFQYSADYQLTVDQIEVSTQRPLSSINQDVD